MKYVQVSETKNKFLNLFFNDVSLSEAVQEIRKYIVSGLPHYICTLGAELVVRAQKDEFLNKVYNNADMLTIDSKVVFYSAVLCGLKFKEPVSAVRLTLQFLDTDAEKGSKFYILGAKQEVLERAVVNLKKQYPKISIVGFHNGYFDIHNCEEVISDIRAAKPDILLVAMSSPLKEEFIFNNYKRIGIPVSIGVGGAIDVIAGKAKLAHPIISSLGLEWFYRFIQEPRRLWKRYLTTNSLFVWYIISYPFRRNK